MKKRRVQGSDSLVLPLCRLAHAARKSSQIPWPTSMIPIYFSLLQVHHYLWKPTVTASASPCLLSTLNNEPWRAFTFTGQIVSWKSRLNAFRGEKRGTFYTHVYNKQNNRPEMVAHSFMKDSFHEFRHTDYQIIITRLMKGFSHFSAWRLDSFQGGWSERDITKLVEPKSSCLKSHFLRLQVRFKIVMEAKKNVFPIWSILSVVCQQYCA